MFFVRGENLVVTAMPAAADIARTSLILIFAFAGIESALIPSGEVRDSERTVPRAIALAMLGITALYIALQVVAQGILGDTLAQSTVSPLADAAGASLGPWASSLLLAGASISMFGYLGGMTLSIPRIVYALARDGFLPRALAMVDPAHRVPQAAIVAQAILTLALAITGTFEKLAIFANVSALALYFGCAAAAWKIGQSPIVPVLACGVIAWLLTGLTASEWLGFGACLLVASIVYFASRYQHVERSRRKIDRPTRRMSAMKAVLRPDRRARCSIPRGRCRTANPALRPADQERAGHGRHRQSVVPRRRRGAERPHRRDRQAR